MVFGPIARPAIFLSTKVVHLAELGSGLFEQMGKLLRLQIQTAEFNNRQFVMAIRAQEQAERRDQYLLGAIGSLRARCAVLDRTSASMVEEKGILEDRLANLRKRMCAFTVTHKGAVEPAHGRARSPLHRPRGDCREAGPQAIAKAR